MTTFRIISAISISVFLLGGCNFKVNKMPLVLEDRNQTRSLLTSFDAIKKSIIDPKCLRCHGSGGSGGVNLSNYPTIKANIGLATPGDLQNSRIYTEVASGSMPEGGPALSANEVTAISNWILAGAPDGEFTAGRETPPVVNPPPVTSANFSQIQTKLFDVSCVKCHSGAKPSGKVDLSNYQKLMLNKKNVIVAGQPNASLAFTEITSQSMPPKGNAIDPQLVELLRTWIEAGAKEIN